MKKNFLLVTILLFICLIFYYLWNKSVNVSNDYQKTIDILDDCISKSTNEEINDVYYINGYSSDDINKIITIYLTINSKENQDRILNIKGINKKYIKFDIETNKEIYKHLPLGEESNINDNSMYLKIKDNAKKTGITLILKNISDHTIYYGEDYFLEIKKDNKWFKTNVYASWNDILYSIESNKEEEIVLMWKNIYGYLEPATYRIVKQYNDDLSESAHKYMTIEFTIK